MITYEKIEIGDRIAICVCTRTSGEFDWGADAVLIPYEGRQEEAWHPVERFESVPAAVEAAKIWFRQARASSGFPTAVGHAGDVVR
jgi:hypothetical protein